MKQQISLLFIVLSLCAKSQNVDYSKSPNSFIYDLDIAQSQNYGGLQIPVKKAYEMWTNYTYLKNGGMPNPIPVGTLTASLYWEDVPGLIENVSLLGASSPEESNIKVEVNKGKGAGNAVIAFKVNGVIYWSWHVWVTDSPENGVKYTQGLETDIKGNPIEIQYMDRNLGASTGNFLGNNWQKSGGLLYEWGRKDPFPGLANKDFYFYELSGEVGSIKHRVIDGINTLPLKIREFDDIERNMDFAVKNPLTLVINTDNANWFSNKIHRVEGTAGKYTSWDLWSDNYKGGNGNASSSNTTVKNDSRSYELKSELDPCPDGWRVPSYYGRETVNNNLGPWGRKNSGANDDKSDYSLLKPDVANGALTGIKVYPGIGMDFSKAQNGARNLGMMPISGTYVYYPNSVSPNSSIFSVYQDENSDGGLWSGTYGFDGPRYLGLISDAQRKDISSAGLHGVWINQTGSTKNALAVRCMKDPNVDFIGHFPTNYFVSDKENYTKGLHDPNTYMVVDQSILEIPISKAFSVYNQLLTDQESLATNHLVAKVLWTDNPDLVQSISIEAGIGDVRDGKIILHLNSKNKGNAIVSLHNNSTDTPAYWSWQIWSPGEQPSIITYTTEKTIPSAFNFVGLSQSNLPPITTTFMDRNLGSFDKISGVNEKNARDEANNASGLQYQWGRKDAMPIFPIYSRMLYSHSNSKIFVGSENMTDTGTLSYTSISSNGYEQYYTKEFQEYKSNNEVASKKISENILYSVNNPLYFLYQNDTGELYDGGNKTNNDVTQIRDWVSDKQSQAPERWGHADQKSVYDPCPEGWRVPDVTYTALYTSSKGNSPFYNGNHTDQYNNAGLIQDQPTGISEFYEGQNIKGYYLKFTSDKFNIGNFPYAGMRGELGGEGVSFDRSGVWLASMADLGTGYALAMEFDDSNLQTGTGAYPQAAMSVRCAKDEPRFLVNDPSNVKKISKKIQLPEVAAKNSNTDIYPNPFQNKIYLKNDLTATFEIFDASGKMIRTGKVKNKEIEAGDLLPGIYILKITESSGNVITRKMIKTKS